MVREGLESGTGAGNRNRNRNRNPNRDPTLKANERSEWPEVAQQPQ
jgi:hypothetical protein